MLEMLKNLKLKVMKVKDLKLKIKKGTLKPEEATLELSKLFLIADLGESIALDLSTCTIQEIKKALTEYYTASKKFRRTIEDFVQNEDFISQLGKDSDEVRETFNQFITYKK